MMVLENVPPFFNVVFFGIYMLNFGVVCDYPQHTFLMEIRDHGPSERSWASSPTSQEGGRTTTLSGTQERLAVAEFADKMQQVRVTSTSHD